MKYLFLLFITPSAFAAANQPWSHESEASVVQVSGASSSNSYSAKQKTSYTWSQNSLVAAGRYLETSSGGVDSARAWDASLRYERALSEIWSLFAQHGAESDPFASYVQRDNSDLGAKYFLIKAPEQNLFTEFGVRYVKTIPTVGGVGYNTSGRLYAEYFRKISETWSAKVWIEYLPNFSEPLAWLLNYEPSTSVMLSKNLSIKVSYLVKHHDKILTPGESRDERTFTTSLVASF